MSDDTDVKFLQQQLQTHIENFDNHVAKCDEQWQRIIDAQEANTTSIDQLTKSTMELSGSTKDIISAWDAANGTVKTMSAVGRFFKWLSGFAVLGAMAKWILDHS